MGPLKKCNMFPKERMWGTFTRCVRSRKNPEVSIIRYFHVLQAITARKAEANTQVSSSINPEALPGFVHAAGTTNVQLYDGKGEVQQTMKNFCGRARSAWRMELHKFAYKFDEDYASVWSKFYGATGTSMLNANGSWKTDSVIEGMLDEWK